MSMENPSPNTTELTRVPQQARSREKFDAILTATLRLIHEKGYERVSMREIARDVSLPIASIYQYFPNKLAIVRQLWESYTASLGALLRVELDAVTDDPSEATLNQAVSDIVDHMVAHHRDNPEFVDIWRCVDASAELRASNLQDTIWVAETIRSAILQIEPTADEEEVMSRALIACEAASATVKLARELPPERLNGLYKNLKSVLISIFAEAT